MATITRRSLLRGGLLVFGATAGAGFGLIRPVHHILARAPLTPPLALTDALARQQALFAEYQATINAATSSPAPSAVPIEVLKALQTDIGTHGSALRAVLDGYPGWRYSQSRPTAGPAVASATSNASATTPAPIGSTVAIAAATTAASAAAAADCLSWPSTDSAGADTATHVQALALLASISACLSTHVRVLQ